MNPIVSIICLTFAVQSILPAGLPLNQLNPPSQVCPLDPSPQALGFVLSDKTKQTGLGINSPKHLRSSLRSSVSAGLIDSNLTFTYDALSRLTSASTANSAAQLPILNKSKFSIRTAATSAIKPSGSNVTISYTYDKNGDRKTMNDGSGGTTYNYDNLNRITSIINPSSQTVSFTYDPLSRRKTLTYPNNTSASYSYDSASQLTAISHQLSAVPFSSFSYTYNDVGNRTQKTHNATPSNYGYDNLHRIISATNPTESYAYDLVGNRNPLTSTYNSANRLLNDGTFTYSYDDNGNLISKVKISNGETTTYSYDAENQLTQINLPSGSIVQYRYDGLGRRIEKDVNGTLIRYIYDNEDILFEYDGTNTQQARYTHGLGIDEPLIMARGGQDYFYHADALGSVINLTDSTGTNVQSYQYDAFGKIISQTGSLTNPYTFTGREFDPESGLYYFRARHYDANTGRFLQEDPIGSVGDDVNLYQYVFASPVNLTDPTGLFVFVMSAPTVIAIAVTATAGVITYYSNRYKTGLGGNLTFVGGKLPNIMKGTGQPPKWGRTAGIIAFFLGLKQLEDFLIKFRLPFRLPPRATTPEIREGKSNNGEYNESEVCREN